MGQLRNDLNAFKDQQRELNQSFIERLNYGSMSIEHVIGIIVTQKKSETQKNVSPHRNRDFHYFSCKSVLSHTL